MYALKLLLFHKQSIFIYYYYIYKKAVPQYIFFLSTAVKFLIKRDLQVLSRRW